MCWLLLAFGLVVQAASAVGSVPNPFAIPGLAGLGQVVAGVASPAIAATMIVAAGRWCGAPATAAAAILTGHLALTQVQRAISEGVPVDGYVHWSAQDNFEWMDGFGTRFGLIYVDFDTQQRIPKLSAEWFREAARQNALV